MNYNIKYCIKCGTAFDIGTNFDLCLKCRREKEKKEVEEDGKI